MENRLNKPIIQRGQLLVSSPAILEPVFSRSVVFILEAKQEKGYLGLVLNHPMPATMADLVPGWEKGGHWRIFNGGPVELSRLFMLHTMGDVFKGSHEIAPGIFIGGELKDVTDYLQHSDSEEGQVRFFMGYSGWEAGQLEAEIAEGSWTIKEISDPELLLVGEGVDYWRREVLDLGEVYRSWSVMPEAPQIN